jgi:hypothetical protein
MQSSGRIVVLIALLAGIALLLLAGRQTRAQTTGSTTRVSVASDGTQGDSVSAHPSISADGRSVAFWSAASNLVSDTNLLLILQESENAPLVLNGRSAITA